MSEIPENWDSAPGLSLSLLTGVIANWQCKTKKTGLSNSWAKNTPEPDQIKFPLLCQPVDKCFDCLLLCYMSVRTFWTSSSCVVIYLPYPWFRELPHPTQCESEISTVEVYYIETEYTPAVRSKILSKLIFASCVSYSHRAYYGMRVVIKDIRLWCGGQARSLHYILKIKIHSYIWCTFLLPSGYYNYMA